MYFAIITLPRSGSYLLVDLLNQVPGIRCHPEIFKPGRLELDSDMRPLVKWTVARRDERPIGYMRTILRMGDYAATGFKFFPEHNKKLLSHITTARYIHKVVLSRHPISRYISRMRAEATGRWVRRNDDERGLESKVTLQFESGRFEQFLRHHNKFTIESIAAADATPSSYTLVDYEEVVSLRALEVICRSLAVTPADPSTIAPSLQKQTTEPLSELVANYEDMKTYLQQSHPTLLSQPGCPHLP